EFVGEAHKQHELVLIYFGTLLLQGREVFPVHRQNKIKLAEVVGGDLASHTMRQFVAAFTRSCLGPCVGGLANMKAVGASRIYADHVRKPCFVDDAAKHALCAG